MEEVLQETAASGTDLTPVLDELAVIRDQLAQSQLVYEFGVAAGLVLAGILLGGIVIIVLAVMFK